MLWLVFAGIALAGLVMVGCYAVSLAHKGADLLSEVGVLADRGGQLVTLLGQLSPPPRALGDPMSRAADPEPDVRAVLESGRSMTLTRHTPASEKRK